MRLTPSFPLSTLRSHILPRLPLAYATSLSSLLALHPTDLAAFETSYVCNGRSFVLYDVKCKARFEDDVVDRICKEWTETKVCPLRRGISVGLLDEKHVLAVVGNCKFFYGEEKDILEAAGGDGKVVLAEKANGEYTMIGGIKVENDRFLVFGSKNVRLALPYDEADPMQTMRVFKELSGRYVADKEVEDVNRFSYLGDMIKLWLNALGENPNLIKELDAKRTVVGEQVGVHAHIFTGYDKPHIRVFASLPLDTLDTSFGCSLTDLRDRLFPGSESADSLTAGGVLRMVNMRVFDFKTNPEAKTQVLTALNEISRGSMDVYGEGTVAYAYDAKGECVNLFKFKCQEYAFDRRLRTLLSRGASELAKNGMTLARLRDESRRVSIELDKSYRNDFNKMSAARAEDRVAMVPAIFSFLDRHQLTIHATDFSDQYTSTLAAVQERRKEYARLAMTRFTDLDDPLLDVLKETLSKYEKVDLPALKSVEEMAEIIVGEWHGAGGVSKFPLLGIASSPGGGKTSILNRASELIQAKYGVQAKVCDRDAYALADPTARGDTIHRVWMEDIKQGCELPNTVILVGNTFAGAFADKLEKDISASGKNVFLAALAEHTIPVQAKRIIPMNKGPGTADDDRKRALAAMFDFVCLTRLCKRVEPDADGSTLSMSLGARIVLEKFFSSQPDENMLKRRLKDRSACVVSAWNHETVTKGTGVNLNQAIDIARSVVDLRMKVTDPKAIQAMKLVKISQSTSSSSAAASAELTSEFKPKLIRIPEVKIAFGDFARRAGRVQVKFASISAEPLTAKSVYKLADADLIRCDAHITLRYKPDAMTVTDLVKQFEGQNSVSVPITCKVTVAKATGVGQTAKGNRLQFLVVHANAFGPTLGTHAHVTLGSTDIDVLPYSMSGRILQALQAVVGEGLPLSLEIGSPAAGPVIVSVERVAYNLWIEPFSSPIMFTGAPVFMCSVDKSGARGEFKPQEV